MKNNSSNTDIWIALSIVVSTIIVCALVHYEKHYYNKDGNDEEKYGKTVHEVGTKWRPNGWRQHTSRRSEAESRCMTFLVLKSLIMLALCNHKYFGVNLRFPYKKMLQKLAIFKWFSL